MFRNAGTELLRLGNLLKAIELAGGEAGIQTQRSDLELHATDDNCLCKRATVSQRSDPVPSGTKGTSRYLHLVRTPLPSDSADSCCGSDAVFATGRLCWKGSRGSGWGLVTTCRVFSSSACVTSAFPLNTAFVCSFLQRLVLPMLPAIYPLLIAKKCLSLGLFTWLCGSVCSDGALHAPSVFLSSISILCHVKAGCRKSRIFLPLLGRNIFILGFQQKSACPVAHLYGTIQSPPRIIAQECSD